MALCFDGTVNQRVDLMGDKKDCIPPKIKPTGPAMVSFCNTFGSFLRFEVKEKGRHPGTLKAYL
jgi:hypothetical protein